MKRIMIAAPASGSGKTLLTCGLLKVLKEKYQNIISYKCGPDYIDPMFHRSVIGIPSLNLDTYFQSPEEIKALLSNDAAFAVMEGVMGIYDGLGGTSEEGSAYHLAKLTNTPIILVMDAHGMGKTMVSILKGICADDTNHLIRGIILNRTSISFAEKMRPLIEAEVKRPLLGVLPKLSGINLESRHLGLKLPDEVPQLQKQLELVADAINESIDVAQLEALATESVFEKVCEEKHTVNRKEENKLTLAVARDEAFCFYYEQNLEAFRKKGVEIIEFSPLHDDALPACDGVLLGGGYPELCAKELSENHRMLSDIRKKITAGLPTLAECGGFMYLHERLKNREGEAYQLVGVIPGETFDTGKLCRFGYVSIEIEDLLVRGHEFHYFDSTNNGADAILTRPATGQEYCAMHKGKNYLWGFAHLYYPSAPELVEWFVKQMEEYHGKFI